MKSLAGLLVHLDTTSPHRILFWDGEEWQTQILGRSDWSSILLVFDFCFLDEDYCWLVGAGPCRPDLNAGPVWFWNGNRWKVDSSFYSSPPHHTLFLTLKGVDFSSRGFGWTVGAYNKFFTLIPPPDVGFLRVDYQQVIQPGIGMELRFFRQEIFSFGDTKKIP